MAIEKAAAMDEEGFSEEQKQVKGENDTENIKWQGLTPRRAAPHANEPRKRVSMNVSCFVPIKYIKMHGNSEKCY